MYTKQISLYLHAYKLRYSQELHDYNYMMGENKQFLTICKDHLTELDPN